MYQVAFLKSLILITIFITFHLCQVMFKIHVEKEYSEKDPFKVCINSLLTKLSKISLLNMYKLWMKKFKRLGP